MPLSFYQFITFLISLQCTLSPGHSCSVWSCKCGARSLVFHTAMATLWWEVRCRRPAFRTCPLFLFALRGGGEKKKDGTSSRAGAWPSDSPLFSPRMGPRLPVPPHLFSPLLSPLVPSSRPPSPLPLVPFSDWLMKLPVVTPTRCCTSPHQGDHCLEPRLSPGKGRGEMGGRRRVGQVGEGWWS